MEKEIIAAVLFVCVGVYMSITGTKTLLGYFIAMMGFFLFIEGLDKRGKRKTNVYEDVDIEEEYNKIPE